MHIGLHFNVVTFALFETAAHVVQGDFSVRSSSLRNKSAKHLMKTGLCVSNAELWIKADERPIGLKSSHKKGTIQD